MVQERLDESLTGNFASDSPKWAQWLPKDFFVQGHSTFMDDPCAEFPVPLEFWVFVVRSVGGDYSMIAPADASTLHFCLVGLHIPQWSQEATKLHVKEMLTSDLLGPSGPELLEQEYFHPVV